MKEGSKRGRAVIMSFTFFTDAKLQPRPGTDADIINLKNLLVSLQFTVETVDNRTQEVPYDTS